MNARSLLVGSLCLNFLLVGGVGYLVSHQSNPASNVAPPAKVVTNKLTSATPAKTDATKTVKLIDWRVVESSDYREYIANLRAIGCPEETIRDIIIADVNKLFEARKKEIKAKTAKKQEYWKTANMFAGLVNEERTKQLEALNNEKRALLKELLGVAPEEKPDLQAGMMNQVEAMLDFLPADKQTEVMRIMQEYQSKLLKNFGKGGQPDADDLKNMLKVRKEMEAEMAKTLTPEQFQDYQLRLSETSMMLRMQLGTFDPSEQEYKDIFKIRKSFDDEYPALLQGSLTKEEREKRQVAENQMKDSVKQMLGPERYADYERSQDYNFQSLAKVAEKNGLPKDSAVKVFDMKKIAEEQANKVRNDSTLTQQQRQSALAAIRTETERSVQQVFGDKGFEYYQNQPTSYWLKNLNPDPPAPQQ